jgi:signal transduction histidine kinase
VDSVLALARFDSREYDPAQLQPVDVGRLVRLVADELADAALHAGVAVEFDLPPAGREVPGDAEALAILLRNLMDDAIHHARAAVRIEAVLAGGRVVLAVRDDGPGMTAEQARRAFDRFYRSGAGGGSGLGLFLVRRIAKLHGGDARIGAGLGAAGVGIEVDLRAPGARQFTESREAG